MLAVYTFVFRLVLKAKWPGNEGASDAEFALQLFAGLIVFGFFSDVVGRAPGLISEQPNMVKKVIFPLSIMPWVSVLSSALFTMISTFVMVVGVYLAFGELNLQLIALPLIAMAFVPILLGFSWLLSSLGVYLRDLGQIVGLILPPLMFLSPVFYPASALPDFIQSVMLINPLVVIIDALRSVTLMGQWPNFQALFAYFAIASVLAVVGAACFHKLRRGFADVL